MNWLASVSFGSCDIRAISSGCTESYWLWIGWFCFDYFVLASPMNDTMAMETIEKHKYLLLEVQNRAAIAYFAAANRNLSLYHALKKYIMKGDLSDNDDFSLLSSSEESKVNINQGKKDEEKIRRILSQ